MSNALQKFEEAQLSKLSEGKELPKFKAGDTVRVNVKIIEGSTERVQAFEGVCIAKKNRGIHSSFIVRKISHGEGVERIFPLYSPRIDSIKVIRRGIVRRAKLYYMRALTGKAARIREKIEYTSKKKGAKATANAAKNADKKAASHTTTTTDKKAETSEKK